MRTKLIIGCIASVVALAAGPAAAITYIDFNDYDDHSFLGITYDVVDGENPLHGTFNILNPDLPVGESFDPNTEVITDAMAIFTFVNLFGWDKATIELANLTTGVNIRPFSWTAASITFDGTLIADLQADGVMDYSIVARRGSFGVDWAKLKATAIPGGGVSVVDGSSTILALGLALLGIEGIRRRLH